MEDEATVCMHGAAEEDGNAIECSRVPGFERNFGFVEESGKGDFQGAIYDEAECSVSIVFGNEHQGSGKKWIVHRRHGNEKMIGKIQRLHAAILIAGCPSSKVNDA